MLMLVRNVEKSTSIQPLPQPSLVKYEGKNRNYCIKTIISELLPELYFIKLFYYAQLKIL